MTAFADVPAPPVVGGQVVAEGSWPDAASIYFGNSVDWFFLPVIESFFHGAVIFSIGGWL